VCRTVSCKCLSVFSTSIVLTSDCSYAMFHPLAYLFKLNIEMSMAHLIKTIAVGNQHNSADPSSMLTLSSSSDADVFANTIFEDTQQHSLLRGLFGREQVVLSYEDVRSRNQEYASRHEAHDLQSRSHTEEPIQISANGVDSKEAKNRNYRVERGSQSRKKGAVMPAHAQPIHALKPVYSCGRSLEASP
jgi:hypothetical protein